MIDTCSHYLAGVCVGTGALAALWPVLVERFSRCRSGRVQLGLQLQDVVDDVLQDLRPAGGGRHRTSRASSR